MTTSLMPAEIAVGDRLKWRFPNGVTGECTVEGIRRTHEEGIELYTESFLHPDGTRTPVLLRALKIEWLTKRNERKLQSSGGRTKKVDSAPRTREAEPFSFRSTGEKEMADTRKRKSLDDMSVAHRNHIEKWEPHLEALRGEHVWAAVMRVPGRGATGPCYVALKRGAKDYVIVDYDTEKQINVTPKRVLEDGFESSGSLMETFKTYRQKARDERKAAGPATKASKPPKRKAAPKKAAPKKAAKSKASAKKKATRKPRKPASKK